MMETDLEFFLILQPSQIYYFGPLPILSSHNCFKIVWLSSLYMNLSVSYNNILLMSSSWKTHWSFIQLGKYLSAFI